jgi:hypothetical protein
LALSTIDENPPAARRPLACAKRRVPKFRLFLAWYWMNYVGSISERLLYVT